MFDLVELPAMERMSIISASTPGQRCIHVTARRTRCPTRTGGTTRNGPAPWRKATGTGPGTRAKSAKSGNHLVDEQGQGLLLLLVRHAVVAPEAVLVHAQLLVRANPLDDFGRRADHRGPVQRVELELRSLREL